MILTILHILYLIMYMYIENEIDERKRKKEESKK